MSGLTTLLRKTQHLVVNNAPAILTAIGASGVIGTCRASGKGYSRGSTANRES